jgi:hypothetical protein
VCSGIKASVDRADSLPDQRFASWHMGGPFLHLLNAVSRLFCDGPCSGNLLREAGRSR